MRNSILVLIFICLVCAHTFAAKCLINDDKVFVIDGKKVFPIGFTMPPPPEGKTPSGKNAIDELHEAGATFLRTGVMGTNWDEATFDLQQKWLDAARRNQMYVLFNLREASSIDGQHPKNEELLRKILARFKDHPALACWKGVDEPQWGKHPIGPMVAAYQLIRQIDPDHPMWVNHAPRGEVEDLKAYNVALDITGADIYPIGYPPGTHSLRANKNISMVGDYTKLMMEVSENKRPVCMVLQIAWSGVIKEGKTLRFPTFAEERFMTYQAIINGSRGVLYFGGHIGKACTAEDAKLGWNWTFWNRVLRPVVEEIGEKSVLYPALVAGNSKIPIQCSGEGMEFVVREVGDEVFILACKREGGRSRRSLRGCRRIYWPLMCSMNHRGPWKRRTELLATGSARSRFMSIVFGNKSSRRLRRRGADRRRSIQISDLRKSAPHLRHLRPLFISFPADHSPPSQSRDTFPAIREWRLSPDWRPGRCFVSSA